MFKSIYYFFENFSFSKDDDDGLPECCKREEVGCCCCCNHKHFCCNDNYYCRAFGRYGISTFDRHRKFFFGLSSFTALICLILSIYSCCANSYSRDVIKNTYWGAIIGRNDTSGGKFIYYVGLRAVVAVTGCDYHYNGIYDSSCGEETHRWSSVACDDTDLGDACAKCKQASKTLFWITIGAVGCHLQSFQDSQTRMRIIADSPAIKFVAILNDMSNSVFLISSLKVFSLYCDQKIHDSLEAANLNVETWLGPGYVLFIFTVLCAGWRLFLHFLTPVPKDEWGFGRSNKGSVNNNQDRVSLMQHGVDL